LNSENNWLSSFLKGLAFTVSHTLFRVTVIGKENIPKSGACIICPNHINAFDPFLIGCHTKRLVHYMAKEELFKIKPIGFILRSVGSFPIKRGKSDITSIKNALALLEEGKVIGVYPEGTRNRRGKEIKLKPGAVMLAITQRVPIIPTAVYGNFRPFGRVNLIFGKPIVLEQYYDTKPDKEKLLEITKDIMNSIITLMEVC
jgi:1-acyl-sn-glycerol-3-phosphate acyltransferase